MRISDWSSDVCSSDLLTATSTGQLDLGTTEVSGALVAHSNGGAIVQGGALQVGGTTELDAGTGDVALAHAGNDFVGAVDITGGTVAITDANALTLGTVSAGQLTATSTGRLDLGSRSEEHTSELQSLMRNSYAVFCL